MSNFIRQQIAKRLEELRADCALQRLHLKNAHGRRWSGCPRQDPDKPSSWDLHWENLQAKAQEERPEWVAKADKELSDFIAEHRAMMGADWIGNDHGRLCWADFLGGTPIDHHYCQKQEGHQDAHGNEIGEWPQGVSNNHEWHRMIESIQEGKTGLQTINASP